MRLNKILHNNTSILHHENWKVCYNCNYLRIDGNINIVINKIEKKISAIHFFPMTEDEIIQRQDSEQDKVIEIN